MSPLLIITLLPKSFGLEDLEQSSAVSNIALINRDSFEGIDQVEALVDGMAFIIKVNNTDDTANLVKENCRTTIFGESVGVGKSSIEISPGPHLQSGKHIPAVNKALLQLANVVGEELSASHILWLPAQQSIGFDHFSEAVRGYLDGGPTPILVQIAIEKSEDRCFHTRGLDYFSDQEISMNAPEAMSDSDAIKRLVRISHDIAVNGKVDNRLVANGLEKGERISYRPSPNLKELKVEIAFA